MMGLLGEGFTLPLQQAVTGLGSLELRLHDTQRLSRREDGLAILGTCLVRPIRVECNRWVYIHQLQTYWANFVVVDLGWREGGWPTAATTEARTVKLVG